MSFCIRRLAVVVAGAAAALFAAGHAEAGGGYDGGFFSLSFGFPIYDYGYAEPYAPYPDAPAYAYPPYDEAPVYEEPYGYSPYGADRDYCREFQTTVVIDGRPERAFGTACLQPDGSWAVVD
jgi:hypothetical protein